MRQRVCSSNEFTKYQPALRVSGLMSAEASRVDAGSVQAPDDVCSPDGVGVELKPLGATTLPLQLRRADGTVD